LSRILILFFVISFIVSQENENTFLKNAYKKYYATLQNPSPPKILEKSVLELEDILFRKQVNHLSDYYKLFSLYYSIISTFSFDNFKVKIIYSYNNFLFKKNYKSVIKENYSFASLFTFYLLILEEVNTSEFQNDYTWLVKNLSNNNCISIYLNIEMEKSAKYTIAGQIDRVIRHNIKLMKTMSERKNFPKLSKSRILKFIGTAFENIGNFRIAGISYQLQKEQRILDLHYYKYGEASIGNLMLQYISLAELNFKSNGYKESRNNLNLAYSFINQLSIPNTSKLAVIHADYGKVYLETGKLDSAKIHLNKAQSLRDSLYQKPHMYLAESQYRWGEYYKKLGDLNKSLEHFHDAYKQYHEVYNKHEFTSMSLYQIAEIHRLKGNNSLAFSFYQKSMANLDKSIDENEQSYRFKNSYDLPPLKRYNSNRHVLDVLTSKARLYKEICSSNGNQLKESERRQLISFYHDIRRILNETEVLYLEEDGKLDLLNDYAFIYDELIELEYQSYEATESKESLAAIFDFMQESKSRLLKYDLYKNLLSEKTGNKRLKSLALLEDSLASFKTNLYKYDFAKKNDDKEHYDLLDNYLTNLFEYLAEKRDVQKEFELELKRLTGKKQT
jgi:hypothetical protein